MALAGGVPTARRKGGRHVFYQYCAPMGRVNDVNVMQAMFLR